MKIEIEIDITDIEDAKAMRNKVALESILTAIEKVLAGRGTVILKRSYCNSPDDIFGEYSSYEEIKSQWRKWLSVLE